MATLNEFLDKALANEAVNKAFADQRKKEGPEGKPGMYTVFFKVDMKVKSNDMDDAMNKGQKIADEISKKYKLYKAYAEVDGVDGP